MSEKAQPDVLDYFENFYETRLTESAVQDGYQGWAEDGKYDADFAAIVHRGHLMVGEMFDQTFPKTGRDKILILDVAAGTGRVGQELRNRGFANLHGLDACAAMLKEAKKKKVYHKLINSRITEEPLDIAADTYDAISLSAGFVEGHLPAGAIKEFVRLIKSGGYIIMVGNYEYWDSISEYKDKMETVIKDLKTSGKIEEVKREIRDGYIADKYKAIIFVLRKLECCSK